MRGMLGDENGNLQGSFGIKNDTNSFLRMLPIGDFGRYLLESTFPGAEPAQVSWERIRDSNILENGGVVISHSQGADLVSNAFNGAENKLRAKLYLLGGANGTLPTKSFAEVHDFRDVGDGIPYNPITQARRLWNSLGENPTYDTSAENYHLHEQLPSNVPPVQYYSSKQGRGTDIEIPGIPIGIGEGPTEVGHRLPPEDLDWGSENGTGHPYDNYLPALEQYNQDHQMVGE